MMMKQILKPNLQKIMDYFNIISLISPVNKYILPVISVAPENATQSIGNVLEDRDAGEEVVVVDEGETE